MTNSAAGNTALVAKMVRRMTSRQSVVGIMWFPGSPYRSGAARPFRKDLGEILTYEELRDITDAGSMAFHCIGNIGSVKDPELQRLMERGKEQSLETGDIAPSLRGAPCRQQATSHAKGWPIRNLTAAATAAREAYEEAGLVGNIVGEQPLACYRYEKRRSSRKTTIHEVSVYLFAIERQLRKWPEKAERQTRWFAPAEAATLVAQAGLADIVETATRHLLVGTSLCQDSYGN